MLTFRALLLPPNSTGCQANNGLVSPIGVRDHARQQMPEHHRYTNRRPLCASHLEAERRRKATMNSGLLFLSRKVVSGRLPAGHTAIDPSPGIYSAQVSSAGSVACGYVPLRYAM